MNPFISANISGLIEDDPWFPQLPVPRPALGPGTSYRWIVKSETKAAQHNWGDAGWDAYLLGNLFTKFEGSDEYTTEIELGNLGFGAAQIRTLAPGNPPDFTGGGASVPAVAYEQDFFVADRWQITGGPDIWYLLPVTARVNIIVNSPTYIFTTENAVQAAINQIVPGLCFLTFFNLEITVDYLHEGTLVTDFGSGSLSYPSEVRPWDSRWLQSDYDQSELFTAQAPPTMDDYHDASIPLYRLGQPPLSDPQNESKLNLTKVIVGSSKFYGTRIS